MPRKTPRDLREELLAAHMLAIDPRAAQRLLDPEAHLFDADDEDDEEDLGYELEDGIAVIEVMGPLMHRGGWFWDGYESIEDRFEKALADPQVKAVALMIDSPGGMVAGCFDAVREMRAMKAAAGKPVLAVADEHCYSGAYAVACVADEIVVPEAGGVGSVGVLSILCDETKQNEKYGLNVQVVRSGEQKAEGHPDLPLTADAVAREQAEVDRLAAIFAGIVGESRRMAPATVLALDGACISGPAAVTAGLADRVGSWDQAMDALRARINPPAQAPAVTITWQANLGATATPRDVARRAAAALADPSTSPRAVAPEEPQAASLQEQQTMRTILIALGLAETASEAEALASVTTMQQRDKAFLALTGAESFEAGLGTVQAWKTSAARVPALEAQVTSLSVQVETTEREKLLADAGRAGKVTPAMLKDAEWQKLVGTFAIDTLRAYLATLPPQIATGEPLRPAVTEDADEVSLTAEEKHYCEAHRISEASMLKTKREAVAARKTATKETR